MGMVRRIESDKEDSEGAGGDMKRATDLLLEPVPSDAGEEHHQPYQNGSCTNAIALWAAKFVQDTYQGHHGQKQDKAERRRTS